MALDFTTIVPVGAPVSPSALGAALNVVADHIGVAGNAVPVIASASTCAIFAGTGATRQHVEVSGSATISSFGANDAGAVRLVRFQSAGLVINHSASLLCPGGINITTDAGTLLVVIGRGGSDATVWLVVPPTPPQSIVGALPPGYIHGLTLANNTTDAANDIDVSPGRARDADDAVNLILAAGITKRLDAAWSAGTDQGGIDTGSKSSSTTYHVHLISTASGGDVDVLFSLSPTAPTMPSGYTRRRRLGAVITDGSANIRAFTQKLGGQFELTAPPLSFNATVGDSRTLAALTVPDGIVVEALIRAYNASSDMGVIIQPVSEADASATSTAAPLHSLRPIGVAHFAITTNTSREIAMRSSASLSGTVRVATRGWIDRRDSDG